MDIYDSIASAKALQPVPAGSAGLSHMDFLSGRLTDIPDSGSRNAAAFAAKLRMWTKKNSARDPSRQGWVFGCKAHVVADANHDMLPGMVVTTASRNDSPFLPSPLAELASGHSWFSLPAGVVVIADRRYDSRSNNAFVHRNGGVPVIHQRGLPDGKLYDGIYTSEGAPTCLGGRWCMSALIPIPGITCTAARRRLRPARYGARGFRLR